MSGATEAGDPQRYCLEHSRRMDDHDRRLHRLETVIDRIKVALFGDANTAGLSSRIARIEELIAEQRKVKLWFTAAVLTALMNLLTSLALFALASK